MSATKLSDLLPIPDGVSNPNAYQVFGLRGGEKDVQQIKSAVKSVYQSLKTSKKNADPEVWKTAAKLASSAKETLEDPARRAELDAKVSVPAGKPPQAPDVPPPPSSAINSSSPANSQADPLAAVLPAGDPLAALLPKSNPLAPASAPAAPSPPTPGFAPPPQPEASPIASGPVTNAPAATAHPPAESTVAGPPIPPVQSIPETGPAPITDPFATAASGSSIGVRSKRRSRRRRKFGGGMVVLGLTVVGLLGIISGIVYFLYKVPPGNSLNENDGPTSIVNPPIAIADNGAAKPKGDGVMGDIGSSGRASQFNSGNTGGSGLKGPEPGNEPMTGAELNSAMNSDTDPMPDEPKPTEPEPTDPKPTEPEPTPATPDPDMTASKPDDPPMTDEPKTPEKPELTPEQIAENEKAIDAVIKLIRDADFEKMKSAANTVTERQLSEDQTVRAFALYHIADLASFYKGAIKEGLGTLKTGNTFEYAEGLRVIIVEKSETELTFMFNRQNRTYTLDNMPPRLGEKLASFALDRTKPDSQAAKAIYESVWKKSNDDYRKATIETLESLDGQLETVEVADIVKMLKVLYPST